MSDEQLTSRERVPLGCRLGFSHAWLAWQDRAHGVHTFAGNVHGQVVIQERRCKHCNAIELRKEKS